MGGTDDPSNLMELTVEEHAEAHKKLYEQHGKWQDKIAWQMLSGQIPGANARVEIVRNYMINRTITDEIRQNMSNGQKRRCASGKHAMLGKKFSLESRKKMSESHKNKPSSTKGKKCTPEEIEKNRQAQLKVTKYECPICSKMCRGKGNLNQHMKAKHKEV